MESDKNNGVDGYIVRSLYFDSVFDDDYFDKEEGFEKRKKIRIRTYGRNNNVIKLEVKEKFGENQLKRSILISQDEGNRMIKRDFTFLLDKDNDFAKELYYLLSKKQYKPCTLVEYKREAYIMKSNDIRITFDRKIMANEGNFDIFSEKVPLYPVFYDIVLEVKYKEFLFEYIKKIIRMVDKKEVSVSKYNLARSIGHF